MSILSTNKKLIKVGQDYSAGSGISIDDGVISVTGEFGKTYSAGDNVDIYEQGEQLYISSKDWTNDIANASANAYNEAVSQIPDPFDPSYLSAQIDNKLNATAFTTWQNGQYTTDLQTIEGQIANKYDTSSFAEVSGSFQPRGDYAERDFVLSSIESSTSGKLDVSSFASVSSDFLTTSFGISESAHWEEATNAYEQNSGTYLTAVDLSPYATETLVEETSGAITSLIPTNYYPDTNPSAFVNEDWVTAQGYITGVNISESATWNEVSTTVQSNSATWGQGGGSTSGLVSGTNFVKKPYYEGATDGRYWSACISGDVQVAYGEYYNDETNLHEREVYSLSAIGNALNDKLDKYLMDRSITIRTSTDNGSLEVYDNVYKRTGLITGSAAEIINDEEYCQIRFQSSYVQGHHNLYSASITAETTATGSIRNSTDGSYCKIVDFSNGSALLTVAFPAYLDDSWIYLNTWDGWGPITNCEATCTVYTSAELAPLAFKDDIPSGGGGDAEVNSFVYDNSATINEVNTSYQTNSGTFLTAVDLSPYYTTAEAETLSSMLSGAIDYVSANAGDEFPVSADEAIQYVQTNSGTIDDTVSNVQTNSGVWGGSALPISAGPGVKVNLVDNTLVFSNDETLLWSGALTVGNTAQMAEPVSAFESYKLYLIGYERKLKVVNEFWTDGSSTGNEPYKVNPIIFQAGGGFFTINAGDCIWNTTWDNLQYVTGYNKWMPYTESTWNQMDTSNSPTIVKIIGINRK